MFPTAAFIKFFSVWFPADTAPRKEAALTDESLSPVPEATSSVHRVSKATQTQPSSTSPTLSREKVSSALLCSAVVNTEFVLNLSHHNLNTVVPPSHLLRMHANFFKLIAVANNFLLL